MERVFFEMVKYYSGDPHQIQHFTKVHDYARMIGVGEKVDCNTMEILEIAAIMHDIGIKPAMEKYGIGNGKLQESEGPPVARRMLENLEFSQEIIERVCYLIGHHHTYKNIDGIDYQILVEADFLVNIHEDKMNETSIKSVLEKVFRTNTGKEYCRAMFGV